MATFMNLPNVLPIAIAGVALAYINFLHEKRTDEASAKIAVSVDDGGEEDGI